MLLPLILAAMLALSAAAGEIPVTSLRFSPDGRLIALAGGDRVRILTTSAGETVFTLASKLSQVFAVAWSPNGKWLAIGGGTAAVIGAVELWDVESRRLVRTTARSGDLVCAVAFAPDGLRFAAATAGAGLQVVDVPGGQTLFRLNGHVGPVTSVAWAPDGRSLASGSADRSIRVWNAEDGRLLRALTNHAGPVEAVVFSPDSQTLYSASSDATIREWIPATGRMKRILRGLDHSVLALDYSPSKNLLVAGCADGKVRFLHAGTGEVRQASEFPESDAPLQAVAVSPDARWFAAADAAGRNAIRRLPQ